MKGAPVIRRPAVSGYFYPSSPSELASLVDRRIKRATTPAPATALIVPHGSYAYCGSVLGAVFSAVALPRRCIILGACHTGSWMPWSLMVSGSFRTPLGDVPVDGLLAQALQQRCPFLETDVWAQRGEHAIEVLLPFLQRLSPQEFSIVPIVASGGESREQFWQLAAALAQVVRMVEEPVLLIASSDLSHYESAERIKEQDGKLLGAIESLSAAQLLDEAASLGSRMCGAGIVAAVIAAARQLDATRAETLSYATSADFGGDPNSAIGYAGVRLF